MTRCLRLCSDVYCSLTNTEEALALSIEQLHGYSVNVTITENHKEHGSSDQVTHHTINWSTSNIYSLLLKLRTGLLIAPNIAYFHA